jgi:regulator of protease activity HflC (stomatin/prohibitin superfamily)
MGAGTIIGIIISLFIVIFIILFLSTSIKVVRFTDEMIVERLGTYRST